MYCAANEPINVAQGIDESNLKRHICAIPVVHLIDHLDSIAPVYIR